MRRKIVQQLKNNCLRVARVKHTENVVSDNVLHTDHLLDDNDFIEGLKKKVQVYLLESSEASSPNAR